MDEEYLRILAEIERMSNEVRSNRGEVVAVWLWPETDVCGEAATRKSKDAQSVACWTVGANPGAC